MPPLPIDALLPEVIRSLGEHPNLVLTAEPGAGKTTRVPSVLLGAPWIAGGQVLVLEPRRLAARAVARFVAHARGERLGETVGYRVRLESRGSQATRLWFLTEGVLLRMLRSDPYLEPAVVVVLDEFHERHLEGDLALAVLRELQQTVRPDLRIVVMSATLEPGPLRRYLGQCPWLDCPGLVHPVRVEYAATPERRGLPQAVVAGVRRALAASDGDVLVFLPGAAEIRRCQQALAAAAGERDLDVCILHGDLPGTEQDRVLQKGRLRKVILSTNLAESSLTIEGVTAVVDSGLVRVQRHDFRHGMNRLVTERVSRASADQRQGRAGRSGPGFCLRLWDEREQRGLLPQAAPEIRRVELSGACLALLSWGVGELARFGWFETPEAAALDKARELLVALGAVDGTTGKVTATGEAILDHGVEPRLGRMLVEAQRRGCAAPAALLLALSSEREVIQQARSIVGADVREAYGVGGSDLWLRAELFEEADRAAFAPAVLERLGLDRAAVQAVRKLRDHLLRRLRLRRESIHDAPVADLQRCVLAGFPDRVCLARGAAVGQAVMVGGRGVVLGRGSVVRDVDLFVAIDAEEGERRERSRAVVHAASYIEQAWLRELFPHACTRRVELRFDAQSERVFEIEQLRYHDLVLEEVRRSQVDRVAAGEVLAAAARRLPRRALRIDEDVERYLQRCTWLAGARPELGLPRLDDGWLGELAAELAAGCASFAEVRVTPVLRALQARLGHEHVRQVERFAPDRVELPSGRQARVEYASGQEPVLAARLQEFFGLRDLAALAGGDGIVLHLLAPNHRPVQVTRDLHSFWQNVYPKIRGELSRRYPKHSWPLDPLQAVPEQRPGGQRRR